MSNHVELTDEVMELDKRCKHSTRYASAQEEAPARTVYISNKALMDACGEIPDTVRLHLTVKDTR